MSTKAEVTAFLKQRVAKNPQTSSSDWYVGIASNPKDRLFNDHGVDEENGQWAYSTANTAAIAREIEKDFLDAGFDGGPGGGDSTSKAVYVYLKTSKTSP